MSDATAEPLAPDSGATAETTHRRKRRRKRHWSRRRRVALYGLSAFAILVVVAGALLAMRYLPYLDRAREAKASAQQLAASTRKVGPQFSQADLDSLTAQVNDVDSKLQPFRDLLATDPLVGVARSIQPLREQIDAGAETVAAADDLVAAARSGLTVGQNYLAAKASAGSGDGSTLAAIVQLMASSTGDVDTINSLFGDAQGHLNRVPANAVSQVRDARELMAGPLSQYAPILKSFASVDDVLPGILGWGGQKKYLVLAEDPAELRPQGGFAGTYGLVTFDNGRLTQPEFHDIYQLDLKPGLPFQEAPYGLASHLLGTTRSWQLADSLWSPDLPTAAQDAVRLYELESGGDHVDGVITLTTYALDRLLQVTGPIYVPDYAITVKSGDVTLTSLALTRNSADPNVNRKQFLQELATSTLDEIFSLPADKWNQLLAEMQDIGAHRLASAWFSDPAAESLAAASPWGGGVLQTPGDYLYVVDSNVAPASKYNLVVTRSTHLDVQLDQFGNAQNTLTLSWQNDSMKAGEPYASLRSYSTGPGGIYGDYVRVITPDRSRLRGVSGGSYAAITGPEAIGEVANRSEFANYIAVPPGSASLAYSWIAPYVVNNSQGMGNDGVGVYTLTIQKQPGMTDEPVSVTISIPEGARITAASAGLNLRGDTASFTGTLTQDTQLAVRYVMGG